MIEKKPSASLSCVYNDKTNMWLENGFIYAAQANQNMSSLLSFGDATLSFYEKRSK